PVETIESCDDLWPLLERNAGSLVLNHDRNGVPVFSRLDSHRRRGVPPVLEGIVHEVGRRGREEVLVTQGRRLANHVDDARHAVCLCRGVIEVHDVPDDVVEHHWPEGLASSRRLGLGDLQELVEYDDQVIDTANAAHCGLAKLLGGRSGAKHLLEAASNLPQWGSEVVGDGIGHIADTFHQTLDPIEHAIDITIQSGELVVRIRHGDAAAQIPALDLKSSVPDGSDSTLELPAYQRRAPDRQQEGNKVSHEKGAHDKSLDLAHVVQIPTHNEHATVR